MGRGSGHSSRRARTGKASTHTLTVLEHPERGGEGGREGRVGEGGRGGEGREG